MDCLCEIILMKWFQRLTVNYSKGFQLHIRPRWKRWRGLQVLKFISPGPDLMGINDQLWRLRESYKKYTEHTK